MLTILCDIQSALQSIWGVILALLVLLFMITVHEFGHFISGKLLKFQINEFAVGMGPKVFSKKAKNGTVYSLRALPLGGFCAFEGETGDSANPKAFHNQKPWKRIIVLVSGAMFNFVSAIIICAIMFVSYGDTVAYVSKVYDYAPVVNQQLEGKIIYKINGEKVYILEGISKYMDQEMTFEVIDENGNIQTISGVTKGDYVTPIVSNVSNALTSIQDNRKIAKGDTLYSISYLDGETKVTKYFSKANDFSTLMANVSGEFTLQVLDAQGNAHDYKIANSSILSGSIQIEEQAYSGVGMSISYAKYKFSFGESLSRVFPFCGEVAMTVWRTLGGMITGAIGLDQVGGPISTISITSQIVTTGFANVLYLIVLISVNLALFNLLPIPALDGCQIIFTVIEWIVGKPIDRKVQSWINFIGLILLLGFSILVDLLKL